MKEKRLQKRVAGKGISSSPKIESVVDAFLRYSKVAGPIAGAIGATKTIVATISQAARATQTAAPVLHIAIKAVGQALLFAGSGLFWLSLGVALFYGFERLMWRVIAATAYLLFWLALFIAVLTIEGGGGIRLVAGLLISPWCAVIGWFLTAITIGLRKTDRNG